jgi:hypothetical protein
MSCGGNHLRFRIGIQNPNFLEEFQMIIPGQFGFNCPSGLREESECSLDGPLHTVGFLFRYEIKNGSYGTT